jgi:hypothetical protein
MTKKISHPYLHVGTTLSPHADAARPYRLLLSLDLSLSLSHRFSEASAEHVVLRGQCGARGQCGPQWHHRGVGHRVGVHGGSGLQGIDGPPPSSSSFLSENLPEMQARVVATTMGADQPTSGGGGWDFEKEGFDNYSKRIFPYFEKWRKAYGA